MIPSSMVGAPDTGGTNTDRRGLTVVICKLIVRVSVIDTVIVEVYIGTSRVGK